MDALQQRIEELTLEVSDLGEKFRKFNGATMSHADTLEQIQADGKRNRYNIPAYQQVVAWRNKNYRSVKRYHRGNPPPFWLFYVVSM